MADPPETQGPTSPISVLLQSLGMTREDLVLHTEQMRAHLSQGNPPEPEPPLPQKARPLRRSRTTSLSNLAKARSTSPPRTPVKAEPIDVSIPARQMDTMQVVMENKRKQTKREQKESSSHSRDARRVSVGHTSTPTRASTPQLTPGTPHHYKYYSERVIGEASSSQPSLDSFDNTNLPRTPSRPSSQFKVPPSRTRHPKTPVARHIYSQASSSRASTPCSSPAPIVNIVSSPGPMKPSAADDDDDDEDDLPYTLPPGPYSTAKPDFSYAALIGQAILSSPEHRLTLQDIYEWITTVYPFYRRDEQTWMNSVRHSLSTMAVFRKVPRGRNEGKSLWAVWDCDLACFAGGGFRKNLCADMVKAKPPAAKTGPKRKTMEETLAARESKRRRKATKDDRDAHSKSIAGPSLFNPPMLPPFYAPVYPNAQQQPYYTSYIAQPLPAEVIFPPLPAHSAYRHITSANASRTSSVDMEAEVSSSVVVKVEDPPSFSLLRPSDAAGTSTSKISPKAPSSSSSDSSLSLPGLTPNCSSSTASSPPLSSEPSLGSIETDGTSESATAIVSTIMDEDEVDRLTAEWLASPSVIEAFSGPSPKGSGSSSIKRKHPRNPSFAYPQSPTPRGRVLGNKAYSVKRTPSPDPVVPMSAPRSFPRMSTPPPQRRPCTPPRKRTSSNTSIQLSAQHTPISHRGLHMSPSSSASLAHYKSNLDPPPPVVFKPSSRAPLLLGMTTVDDPSLTLPSPEMTKTPSRKRTSPHGSGSGSCGRLGISPFAPLTPKRLFAPQSEESESPYRFSRAILDPHDPSALIDEEVQRLGTQSFGDSPTGFFGKRSILYESPSVPDSGRWDRYW